ncbi:saccharopine dehydrogenase [Sphaeroforma arctica JP610]|uniref:Saccharopine dehydrogenase n=1 Tax=Sphaeroforma arctica JP610 TaxID=667725 RepID=A0A0L0FJE9_9EUKA|nr:saccharopine dehydrogenase [Sphaeroforma arctica JP610]KNC76895.1 saccharopine dehydrogenase [Sphaeroforma arctica JP610]|eukprot:XP_014150797.1 saccharopine dehydrogenase [Sphaeroforma arctica JP610]
MPKILLFGAGLVAAPCVEYCLRRKENTMVIATRTIAKGESLAKEYGDRVSCATVDVESDESIDNLMKDCDIAISLVPYIHHANIIKSAVKFKKNFVSTSYVSPAMEAFHDAAVEAGVTVMNEIGVDPGVDHLYAMKVIDEVHAKGGKVKSFISYCGGLPAPENSDNPLGYKFSWSPRGVLLAVRNAARFKQDGKIVDIAGPDLLRLGAKRIYTNPGYATYGYPNRDSSFYDTRYGMPECDTCLRGSLRFEGNVEIVQAFADCGLLSLDEVDFLASSAPAVSCAEAMAKLLNCADAEEDTLKAAVAAKANLPKDLQRRVLNGFKWFGLFSKTEMADRKGTYLDMLCGTMEEKLQLKDDERDMIFLQHEFGIEWADGKKEERTSTLIEYGTPGGFTAMARLVGMPCGVAVQMILDGKITKKGVFAPLTKDIYGPLIEVLEKEEGVVVKDTIL